MKYFPGKRIQKSPKLKISPISTFYARTILMCTQSEIQKISAYKVCLFLKLVSTALRQIVQNFHFGAQHNVCLAAHKRRPFLYLLKSKVICQLPARFRTHDLAREA